MGARGGFGAQLRGGPLRAPSGGGGVREADAQQGQEEEEEKVEEGVV